MFNRKLSVLVFCGTSFFHICASYAENQSHVEFESDISKVRLAFLAQSAHSEETIPSWLQLDPPSIEEEQRSQRFDNLPRRDNSPRRGDPQPLNNESRRNDRLPSNDLDYLDRPRNNFRKNDAPQNNDSLYPNEKMVPERHKNLEKNKYFDVEEMVSAHNKVRGSVDLPEVGWSPQIAQYAQEWADMLSQQGCRAQYHSERKYGENIAWVAGSRLKPTDVVRMWAAEKSSYDYEEGRCASESVCGHYIQLVWQKTHSVGCGVARCEDQELWVCNYDPPSNKRQKPY
ncbi:hypothetical protein CCP2SC5_380010 [Azospirillaceae bacterium]